ncbi:zinc finger protein 11-like [Haliotis cracherodii]|uniref:zinc finger protein 11-like n=1 Tax=Haliotis cracherodii TaxID=6455 RepID=UPI0039EACB32
MESLAEEIWLKVTVVRKVASSQIVRADGESSCGPDTETEDKPVLMKVGEKKNVYGARPQGGDNSHSSHQCSKFIPNESLSMVLILSDDVEIHFSKSVVNWSDALISPDKICVAANVVSMRNKLTARRNTSDLYTNITPKLESHHPEAMPQNVSSSCPGPSGQVPQVGSSVKQDEVNKIADASRMAGIEFCESVSSAFSNTAAYLSTPSNTSVVKPAEVERSCQLYVGENTLMSAPWEYTPWPSGDAERQEHSETDDCEDFKDTSLKPVRINGVSQAHKWFKRIKRSIILKKKGLHRRHSCSDCKIVFPLQRLYLRHKEENMMKKLECDLCEKLFVSPCRLKQHYHGHYKEQGNNVMCLLCKLCFSSRMTFLKHRCQRRHICRICHESFANQTLMNGHIEASHDGGYRCYTCAKIFSCEVNLHRHQKSCARSVQAQKLADGVYQCLICGMTYQSISLFVKHRKNITTDNLVKCSICAQTFTSDCQLSQHTSEHGVNIRAKTCRDQTQLVRLQHEISKGGLPDTAFKCESCHLQFHSKCGLRRHTTLRNCSKEGGKDIGEKIEPYFCENCNKVYSTKTSIFRHKVSKKWCRYYSCNTCSKHFSSQKLLERHTMTHLEQTEDGGYHCSVCDKTYSRRTSYLKHKRRAQCDLTHFLKCKLCFKVYASGKALNTHHKVSHPDGAIFCCNICDRYFSSSKALVKHEALRRCTKPRVSGASGEGTQSMQCETCGKIYSNQSNLNRHRLKHTGERPYSCLECGLKFADKFILKNHVHNIHVGTRPFLCQVCGKRFKTRTHVERHSRGHTDFRLPCSMCNKRYKHAQDLNKHQKKAHDSSLQSLA